MSKKIIVGIIILIIGVFLFLKGPELIDNFNTLKTLILNTGYLGYIIFIGLFVIAALFSLHGSILAILGGIIYGPILGGILSVIGATLGACFAFLVARYLFKNYLDAKFKNNKFYQKINEGIKKNGSDYLIITRLVILFPYNIQNYIYGLTPISFKKYTIITFLTIIPGTFLYTYLAGELVNNNFTLSSEALLKVLIASILLAVLAILPKKYYEKKGVLNID